LIITEYLGKTGKSFPLRLRFASLVLERKIKRERARFGLGSGLVTPPPPDGRLIKQEGGH
jgi:hypothetical protein